MKAPTGFQLGTRSSVVMTKRFLPTGMVFGVGVVCLFLFIFLAKQSDTARENFYKVRKELELYRSGIWRLEKLDLEELNRRLARTTARFPSSEIFATAIGEITELANDYKVSITSITPGQKTEAHHDKDEILSKLERIPVEMRAKGSYESLGTFLSQLSNLEHGVLRIERFRLEKDAADLEYLMLTVAVSVYVKKAPNHEILKEQISVTSPLERRAGQSRFSEITRNPFTKKPVARAQPHAELNLEGIIYDPAAPLVLIDGETKAVGDRIKDMKIIEIQPDSVLLEKGNKRIRMRLGSN